jgi:hypothetical protein
MGWAASAELPLVTAEYVAEVNASAQRLRDFMLAGGRLSPSEASALTAYTEFLVMAPARDVASIESALSRLSAGDILLASELNTLQTAALRLYAVSRFRALSAAENAAMESILRFNRSAIVVFERSSMVITRSGESLRFPGRRPNEVFEYLPTGQWMRVVTDASGGIDRTAVVAGRSAAIDAYISRLQAFSTEYGNNLYTHLLESEFRNQTAFTSFADFRAHIEALPPEVDAAIATILPNRATITVSNIEDFYRTVASINRPLSNAQLQLIANRLSESLGIPTINISDWLLQDLPKIAGSVSRTATMANTIQMEINFAEAVRNIVTLSGSDVTRVYLWRDGLSTMIADTALSSQSGGSPGRVVGALVSRTTITEQLYYGPNYPKAIDANSLIGIIDEAQSRVIHVTGMDVEEAFFNELRPLLQAQMDRNPAFEAMCNNVLQHLIDQGAIRMVNGAVVPQSVMFIDSGLKGIPAFLRALVEIRYPGLVDAHVFYQSINSGFTFLPHVEIGGGNTLLSLEAIGGRAGFYSRATMGPNGAITLNPGDAATTRDSILFNLLLNNQIVGGVR